MRAIYALSDPRLDETRYVGASTDLANRYAGHLSDARKKASGANAKTQWLIDLRAEGLDPSMEILEWLELDDTSWPMREAWRIDHFRARGHEVLNGCAPLPGPMPTSFRFQSQRFLGSAHQAVKA